MLCLAHRGGFSPNLSLSALSGSNDFKINIDGFSTQALQVSSAGDVPWRWLLMSIIVGAPGSYCNDIYPSMARAMLCLAHQEDCTSLSLSALNGSNGFVM